MGTLLRVLQNLWKSYLQRLQAERKLMKSKIDLFNISPKLKRWLEVWPEESKWYWCLCFNSTYKNSICCCWMSFKWLFLVSVFAKVVFFIMAEDITMWNYCVTLYGMYGCMELAEARLSQLLPFGTSQQFWLNLEPTVYREDKIFSSQFVCYERKLYLLLRRWKIL